MDSQPAYLAISLSQAAIKTLLAAILAEEGSAYGFQVGDTTKGPFGSWREVYQEASPSSSHPSTSTPRGLDMARSEG